ncbi:MAG: hypothetical protein C4B59_00885 [Candidatus Methanogaster sp.]|uniref:Uncharacterized protein n=1 Tax=Candidatus Methanogaster sp. TaxID=3386292 RepID=A0AC61L7B3_9EURY|nr:MAG: hypothetical protein C4B59_00885 [ANME-2 cluster archaeon]
MLSSAMIFDYSIIDTDELWCGWVSAPRAKQTKEAIYTMKKEYVIAIVLLAVLVACNAPAAMGQCCPCPPGAQVDACVPGVATGPCPCYCGTSGTVTNGTVHIEYYQYPGSNIQTANFDVPDGNIKWARVYWHIWGGNPQADGWTNATFCNATAGCSNCNQDIPPVDGPNNPNNCDQTECCGYYMGGYGTHWVYWNVTDCITTGSNNLTVDNSNWWDGRIMHIKLIAVIEEMEEFPSDLFPTTNYWINQGYADLGNGNPDPITYTTWFDGPIISAGRNWTLWHLALANHQMNISFNGRDVASYPWMADYYGEKVELINSSWINDSSQNMTWDAGGDDPHPVEAVLVDNDYYFKPDLVVTDKKIEHMNGTCYCQTPTGFVVCHVYDVDALVKNRGGADSGAFNVCLYNNTTRVDTEPVSNLKPGESKWVRLQWHPATAGTHTLRVMADNDHTVNELLESNNNITQNETVDPVGTPDLYAYPCCIDFSPAWKSNATDITVTVLNDGKADASNFVVTVTMTSDCPGDPSYPWSNSTITSVCAKAYKNVTFTSPPLSHCCNYTVTARLDSGGTVTESDETNNNETKVFHAIRVKLKVTHHYGNWSTYNGPLSNNMPVVMFELYKNVTNYTTPYELLASEADVLYDVDSSDGIKGINRGYAASGMSTWYLNESAGGEDPECPEYRPIYWYLFVNGVPTPDMPTRMYSYTLRCGEVVHMDLLKYINSGNDTSQFKPRPIMDFPEPFKRGYDGTFNDTTIVYPNNDPSGDYAALAAAIQSNLVNNCSTHCVSLAGHVHIETNATVGGRKSTDHLILIGTKQENSLIALANANHSEIGMPMYFDSDGLIDDWLYNDDDPAVPDCCSKKNSSYHRVVMACDNPFDNADTTDSWKDTIPMMWIASGVTDCYAKDAAEMLTIGCNQSSWDDKRFWNKSRYSGSGGCGDIDGNCIVDWFDYITLKCAVGGVPGWEIKTSNWASDVDNCNCRVDWFDYITLRCTVGGVPGWSTNCCDDCECDI